MSDGDQPGSRGLRINDYATVLAVILSIVAIAVSFLEVAAMRAQQKASVWPYLSVDQSYFRNQFSLTIENKGVGPALLKDIDWRLDGEQVSDLDQVILDTVGEELAFSYETYVTTSLDEKVLAPGESVTVFGVPANQANTGAFLRGVNGRVTLATCYCSIHGDCWLSELNGAQGQEQPACD
ncbi:MAG: hypothetical protein AAF829_13075 [Pseudomonadota bacterium]